MFILIFGRPSTVISITMGREGIGTYLSSAPHDVHNSITAHHALGHTRMGWVSGAVCKLLAQALLQVPCTRHCDTCFEVRFRSYIARIIEVFVGHTHTQLKSLDLGKAGHGFSGSPWVSASTACSPVEHRGGKSD
jgi:hypothetical protein